MGATVFGNRAAGETAGQAFDAAVKEAQYDYGHAGYTGTICEKDGWVMVSDKPLPLDEAVALGNRLLDEDDARISDKWGPAGAIAIDGGGFYFFGWASC